MPLQAAEVNLNMGCQIDAYDIVIASVRGSGAAMLGFQDIAAVSHDGFGVEKSGREFRIKTRCSHRDGNAAGRAALGSGVAQANLKGLLNRNQIVHNICGIPVDFAYAD
jgi:hypothetical protein